MNISVVGGCGYVGLVTGLGFAALGHRVVGIDADAERVNLHQGGASHIYEDGLEDELKRLLKEGSIQFGSDIGSGVAEADVIFVAVGSPTGIDGKADLSQVRTVANELAVFARASAVIVVKSTVPIGAIEMMAQMISEKETGDVAREVIVNPEFLGEGTGIPDFFNPTRIVIGGGSDRARSVMRELYDPFINEAVAGDSVPQMAHSVPYVETSVADAQMIKYASNAYLAARISFINEVASICEAVGADISTVGNAMGLDPRIGSSYLSPGIGFGGPCLEKDLDALVGFARDHQYEPGYLTAVRARNDQQVGSVISRARDMLGGSVAGKRISVLGLAFKPGTNDVRTSLSLRIVRSLVEAGAHVVGHDPVAIDEAREIFPDVEYSADLYESLAGSDLAMILTAWPEYKTLATDRFKDVAGHARILDGQNMLDADAMQDAGIEYQGIGR